MSDYAPARCGWVGSDDLMLRYHDEEWGVPDHDDRHLFEAIVLDGAQAGLSWASILRRREGYRRAFLDFEPGRVAALTDADIERLMQDSGIIRNLAKVRSAIANARAFLEIQREFGSFEGYVWRLVDGKPRSNRWTSLAELPAKTAESEAMSKDLKKRGFSFVGPTICYAFMQAAGLVNDHLVSCFRYAQLQELASNR